MKYEKEHNLNSFYTKSHIASECIEELKIKLGTEWDECWFIEPSMGTGRFYDLLPKNKRIGIEIDDLLNADIHGDFLKQTKSSLGIEPIPSSKIVVVGNPPFSFSHRIKQRGGKTNLALEFVKHSFTMADTVAFILGLNFCRNQIQRQLPKNVHLIYSKKLPDDSFDFIKPKKLKCVFQIWKKMDYPRIEHSLVVKNGMGPCEDFQILFPRDERANLAIRRYGHSTFLLDKDEDLKKCNKKVQEIELKKNKKIGRGNFMYYMILAKDKDYVKNRFLSIQKQIQEFVQNTCTVSNGNLNQEDLFHLYCQK